MNKFIFEACRREPLGEYLSVSRKYRKVEGRGLVTFLPPSVGTDLISIVEEAAASLWCSEGETEKAIIELAKRIMDIEDFPGQQPNDSVLHNPDPKRFRDAVTDRDTALAVIINWQRERNGHVPKAIQKKLFA